MTTIFQKVAAMNNAFGNPAGNPKSINLERVRTQSLNIADELGELFSALGSDPAIVKEAVSLFKQVGGFTIKDSDIDQVRDALCDITVFAMGAQHLMGVDGDADLDTVVSNVMTRFIKDDADKQATIEKHAKNGITDVYLTGEYPTMVLKSASDQSDAPKDKFLKSASCVNHPFKPL